MIELKAAHDAELSRQAKTYDDLLTTSKVLAQQNVDLCAQHTKQKKLIEDLHLQVALLQESVDEPTTKSKEGDDKKKRGGNKNVKDKKLLETESREATKQSKGEEEEVNDDKKQRGGNKKVKDKKLLETEIKEATKQSKEGEEELVNDDKKKRGGKKVKDKKVLKLETKEATKQSKGEVEEAERERRELMLAKGGPAPFQSVRTTRQSYQVEASAGGATHTRIR